MSIITYVRPDIETVNVPDRDIICQSYRATDVFFGENGEAGSSVDYEDINYGGSF